MKYDLVIFDLDGTLLNTLRDLSEATNHALSQAGFPIRPEEDIRLNIGNGVARLIRRTVPEGTPDDVVDVVLRSFKAYYATHVNVYTQPYPGIPELLDALRAAGMHTAINSNKLDAATQALNEAHFRGCVELALGERADIPKKPAPDGARYIMDHFNVTADHTLYVGDGDADILTAQNAGIDCAWVSWGYRRRKELAGLMIEHSFDTIDELQAFILGG